MRINRDQHADIMFIRHKFAELAALAWQGYNRAGRGYLRVAGHNANCFPAKKDIIDISNTLFPGLEDIEYIPVTVMHEGDYPTENLAEMLASYDARWEIVLAIEKENRGGWASYRFVGDVKPSVAYKHMRDVLEVI
ncbi:MAG: hypothetical protein ACLFTK_07090 [Anaerolineales bacterium]